MFEKIKDLKWLEPVFVAVGTILTAYVSNIKPANLIRFIVVVTILYAIYKVLPILYKKIYCGQASIDKHTEFAKQLDFKSEEMDKMLQYIEKKKKLLKEQGLSDSEISTVIKTEIEKFIKKLEDMDKFHKF